VRRLIIALFLAAVWIPAPAYAAPAYAPPGAGTAGRPALPMRHGGALKLQLGGDGAEGVTVRATYDDGHPLDSVVRMVLTATRAGGRSVGPIQLTPANEGLGFYSSGPVLSPGRWQVVVTAPKPTPGRAASVVDARAPQTAPPAPAVAARPADDAGGHAWLWWTIAGVGSAAVIGIGLALRRRAPADR